MKDYLLSNKYIQAKPVNYTIKSNVSERNVDGLEVLIDNIKNQQLTKNYNAFITQRNQKNFQNIKDMLQIQKQQKKHILLNSPLLMYKPPEPKATNHHTTDLSWN